MSHGMNHSYDKSSPLSLSPTLVSMYPVQNSNNNMAIACIMQIGLVLYIQLNRFHSSCSNDGPPMINTHHSFILHFTYHHPTHTSHMTSLFSHSILNYPHP